jgi:ubiquinone/menaquinone biosynthesis C-methylase UbiE
MVNVFNAADLSRCLVDLHIEKGAVCVDATCANGDNTLYLSKKVGQSGFVYSLDKSQEACRTASSLLRRNSVTNAKVICDDYENIDAHIFKKIDCAIFDLPSDYKNITTSEKLISAIIKTLELLNSGGIINLCICVSNDKGRKDEKKIEKFYSKLNKDEYQILYINQPNKKNLTNKVYFVRKMLIFN